MDTSVPLKEETKTYEQLQQQQLQQQQLSIKKEGTPKKKKAFEIPKLQVSNNPVTKPFQSMRPIRDQREQFSFTDNQDHCQNAKHKASDSEDYCGQALPSEPDERKEDMILIVKSEVFQLDEQKQAKEMLNDFTSQQQAISQIINTDMDHQAIQIANRLKRRSTQHQPLSKANSQPLLNPVENPSSEVCQRIQEDPNENVSSSKLPSVQKQNDAHFQFNLEEQPNSPQKR